jgi:pimeloyl-ACP methyl ester carboxylesterase
VFVDTLPVPEDQPVFALRGSKDSGKAVGVFLHGHCSHGMGYLQAFQYAAAEAGRFVALQGDVHCGGDIDGLDRRIDRALRAYLGKDPPTEILVGGSSQGVERAISLARRFPRKYRRLILSSGFREIPPAGMDANVRAYFLIGEHENRWPTERTVQRWGSAGLAAEMKVIPGAGHGDFHAQGDRLMREAFRFVTGDDVTPKLPER